MQKHDLGLLRNLAVVLVRCVVLLFLLPGLSVLQQMFVVCGCLCIVFRIS